MRNIPSYEVFEAAAPKALLQQFATSVEAGAFLGIRLARGGEKPDDGTPLAEGEWTLARDNSRGGLEWYLTANVGESNWKRLDTGLTKSYDATFAPVAKWFSDRGRRASALTGVDEPNVVIQID